MRRFSAFAARLAAARGFVLGLALLGLAFANPAEAQDSPGVVAAGRAFALKVCWVCHIVAKDQTEQPILSHPGPSFLDVAQRPGLTADGLKKFLSTHNENMGSAGQMPNPRLVDYQIDEVVAYIVSLRTK